jgi:hypothetical protein
LPPLPPPQFDRDAELQAAEVFRSIDLDGDGHLDKDEMRKALAKLHGGQVDEDELGMVMKECDEDGNGVIDELDFGAFAFALSRSRASRYMPCCRCSCPDNTNHVVCVNDSELVQGI